jgi:outer membrane usher protein FimD/PapC
VSDRLSAAKDLCIKEIEAMTTSRANAPLTVALACTLALAADLAHAVDQAASPDDPSQPEPGFDVGFLTRRGIDPRLAEIVGRGKRLAPGEHRLTISVNAQARGQRSVTISADGRACATARLLHELGILMPKHTPSFASRNGAVDCITLQEMLPDAHIDLDPSMLTLAMVIPADSIAPSLSSHSDTATGGVAALLNYQGSLQHSRSSGRQSRFTSINTEAGFNAGEWIFRSRQVYSRSEVGSARAHLDAYAQRSIFDYRAVLQAGQINLSNPLLPGAQVNGVQVSSESSVAYQAAGAVVEGIARSQARVEVRQQDVLIYATVVPEGPFSLSDIIRLNAHSDLYVTIIESDGSTHGFIVPVALQSAATPPPGFVLGAGRVRNMSGAKDDRWAASAGWSGSLERLGAFSAGLMMGDDYYSVGAGATATVPGTDTLVQWQVAGSYAGREDAAGISGRLTTSQSLGAGWSWSASTSLQSEEYRELIDVALSSLDAATRSRMKSQYSIGLAWSSQRLGAFTGHLSETHQFIGSSGSYVGASWSKQIRKASLSLSLDWSSTSGNTADRQLYFNLSMPLGEKARVSGRLRDTGTRERLGVGIVGQLDQASTYRVTADHDSKNGNIDWSAGMSLLPRYTQVDLGYSSSGESSSYSLGLRGGVVLHRDGITASPYPIGESFAILRVGDRAGIQIQTPSGKVWTDAWGHAVAAQLRPYRSNQVQVITTSLPKNTDLNQGASELKVGRATVEHVEFELSSVRRILLTVKDDSGLPIQEGAVTDGANLLAFVQAGGQVFLANYEEEKALWIEQEGSKRCRISFQLSKDKTYGSIFESADAVCRSAQ